MKNNLIIIDWIKENKPLNFNNLFGNSNPVDCEIGFGDGSFIIFKAKNEKGKNFIGIDYSIVSVKKATKRIEKEGLKNIKLIHLDADSAFHLLIPECSLENIYVNFPDPWPKKKHEKRRLLDRSFNLLTASRAKKDARMYILTDDPFYRDFILEEVEHYRVWRPVFKGGYSEAPEGYFQTKYERKWRSMGRKIYYIELKKVVHPAVPIMIEEVELPSEVVLPISTEKLKSFLRKPILLDHSLVKVMEIKNISDGLQINLVLKDFSLFQKKNIIAKPEPNGLKFIIPENVFKGKSLKLLLDNLSK